MTKRKSKKQNVSSTSSSRSNEKSDQDDVPLSKQASAAKPTAAVWEGTSTSTVTVLPPLSRILSVVMLILGILVVGGLFLKVMAGFFVPLFLAALLVVIFRPVHQWILDKSGKRPRLAAFATTSLVLMMVLLPVIAMISVATTQFTSILTHVNFDDLSGTLERARTQLGISLEHPQQFRRLDELADSLDESEDPETGEATSDNDEAMIAKISEARALVEYLHREVSGPPMADTDAEISMMQLQDFEQVVRDHAIDAEAEADLVSRVNTKEQFDRLSVSASASIRTWMRTKLGGTFRSQVRLLANPRAEDFRELLRSGKEVLSPRFVSVTSATGSYLGKFLIGLLVLIVAVYFFLIDGPSMVRTLMRLSPMDDEYEARLLLEFDRTSRAVVLASVVSALAQGVLATIAFWLCGFDSLILLFLVTSMMALVPFLGAASVWVPCAVYLAAVDQRYLAAVLLAVFGAAVISTVDNFIKPFVLQGRTTLHPLFALLSVIGGLGVFGPIGIVVGPMVVVFLQTLLEILSHELAGRDDASEPAFDGADGSPAVADEAVDSAPIT